MGSFASSFLGSVSLWYGVVGGAALLILLMFRSLRVIPARRWALREQLGSFNKLLMPGLHFVWWPFQSLRMFDWTHPGQNNKTVRHRFDVANFDAVQMDLPPVKCVSKDQIQITVDATMTYRVTDLRLAGYETSDPLNLLFQTATQVCKKKSVQRWSKFHFFVSANEPQAIRNTVAELNAGELNGKDELVAGKVVEYVNRLMSKPDRGVRCDQFNVQSISMDKRILEANQKLYATQQEMQQKTAENDLALQTLRMARENQRESQALALAEERARLELAALAAEEEARTKLAMWNGWGKIRREKRNSLNKTKGTTSKLVSLLETCWKLSD
jgi:regulator of protease activity HflC (stomatin/prohibitin superfamily)